MSNMRNKEVRGDGLDAVMQADTEASNDALANGSDASDAESSNEDAALSAVADSVVLDGSAQ
jgi:hypothetical protein